MFPWWRIAFDLPLILDAREPRCSRIRDIEMRYIGEITLQDGGMQAGRDAAMRASHAAGRDVMDVLGSDGEQLMDETRMV
jgi:hypothetical protein